MDPEVYAAPCDPAKSGTTPSYLTTTCPELKTNPTAAASDVAKDTAKFSTAAGKLTNPAVKKAATSAAHQLSTFSDDLTTLTQTESAASATASVPQTTASLQVQPLEPGQRLERLQTARRHRRTGEPQFAKPGDRRNRLHTRVRQ